MFSFSFMFIFCIFIIFLFYLHFFFFSFFLFFFFLLICTLLLFIIFFLIFRSTFRFLIISAKEALNVVAKFGPVDTVCDLFPLFLLFLLLFNRDSLLEDTLYISAYKNTAIIKSKMGFDSLGLNVVSSVGIESLFHSLHQN